MNCRTKEYDEDLLADMERMALAVRTNPILKSFRDELEKCSLWAFRCYLVEEQKEVAPLVDCLIVGMPSMSDLLQLYGEDKDVLERALIKLQELALLWLTNKPTYYEWFVSPDVRLSRVTFNGLQGAVSFYLRAITRRRDRLSHF